MATKSKFHTQDGIKTLGNAEIDGSLTVTGNFTVNGEQTIIDSTTQSVTDSMIELASGNTTSDTLDVGIYGNYNDGLSGEGDVSEYTGLFRDATDSTWKLYDGLEVEPTTTVNTSGSGFTLADLQVGDLTATTLTATNSITGASITYPTTDGTNGQVIKTNGSGTLTFGDIPAGYADSDARSALSAGTGISYNSSTGVITNTVSDTDTTYSAGTGLSLTGTTFNSTITQYADSDARSALSAGTGISFDSSTGVITNTVTNTDTDTTYSAGTGLSLSGTTFSSTITQYADSDVSAKLVSGVGKIVSTAIGNGWTDHVNLISNDGTSTWNVLVDNGANDTLRFGFNNGGLIDFTTNGDIVLDQSGQYRLGSTIVANESRIRIPSSSSDPSSPLAGDTYLNSTSSKVKSYNGSAWVNLSNDSLGEAGNPAADGAALLAESAANGAYYFDHDGTAYETYYIGDVLGGGWQLAMCVTNGATSSSTDRVDWFNGDATVGSGNTGISPTGTDWFTASNSNELNVSSMTALNKTNSRGRGFFKSFTNMMIRQNVGGTVGYRSYVLNASNSLYSWLQTADHATFTNRTSSSSTAGSGVTTNGSTAIRLSNIDFNYLTSNDGGRIVTSGTFSQEASGGISCRVDGHRGYAWAGNVCNDYTARAYSNDGTINDHTLWIFVK